MRFAYADPPYLGMCERYDHEHGNGGCWDEPETHRLLITERLAGYDGWALSMASVNLATILPMCPEGVRIAAWVKPFAAFKLMVNPAFAWEPVVFVPAARKHDRTKATTRDWHAASITLRRGFTGAKPDSLLPWLMGLMRATEEDDLDDLFPGSGAVTRAWEAWRSPLRLGLAA